MSQTAAFTHPNTTRGSLKSQNKLGGFLTWILYSLMAAYAASYVFSSGASQVLSAFKWFPLLALFLYFVTRALQHKGVGTGKTATIIFCALITSAFFSSVLSPYGSASFSELIGLAIVLFNALMLASVIRHRGAIDHFFDIVHNIGRIIITVSFVMALLGISLGRGSGRFSGWADNPNSLAMIIAPALVVLFARILQRRPGWRWRYVPFLLAGLYVIAATGSRGAIGWVFFSFATFALVRMKVGVRLLFIVLAMFVFVTFGEVIIQEGIRFLARDIDSSNVTQYDALLSGRTEAWDLAFESIADHPYLGIGVGNEERLFEENFWMFTLHQGTHAHSSYLSAVVEVGLLGASFLIAAIFIAVTRGSARANATGRPRRMAYKPEVLPLAVLVGALAHGVVETWFLKPGNANTLLFWLLIAYSLLGEPRYPYWSRVRGK